MEDNESAGDVDDDDDDADWFAGWGLYCDGVKLTDDMLKYDSEPCALFRDHSLIPSTQT